MTSRLIPFATANTRVSPVGVQFPQPDVTTASEVKKFDDAVGNWWTVIVWGNDPKKVLPAASLAKLRELGAQLVSVVPITQLEWTERDTDADVLVLGDHTGRLKKWFDERPTPMIFLRPDRFVAGACLNQEGSQTLDAILRSLHFRGPAAPSSRTAVPNDVSALFE